MRRRNDFRGSTTYSVVNARDVTGYSETVYIGDKNSIESVGVPSPKSKARKQDGFYREEEGDFDDESDSHAACSDGDDGRVAVFSGFREGYIGTSKKNPLNDFPGLNIVQTGSVVAESRNIIRNLNRASSEDPGTVRSKSTTKSRMSRISNPTFLLPDHTRKADSQRDDQEFEDILTREFLALSPEMQGYISSLSRKGPKDNKKGQRYSEA